MSRRTSHECFSSTFESDIISLTKENKVSTYRTEHFQAESNNKFTVFKSESHNHDQRNDTTRLKSPILDSVHQMSNKGMTQTQIRKVVSVIHPSLTVRTKIKNIVQYSRLKTRKDKLHDVFVPYYEAIDINHRFTFITTRQLLSACKYSSALAIDCTYKITWNELPLLIFGTSDLNRHFHPLGLCLISTYESADIFKTLFRVLKSSVPLIIQQPYDTHVMADGTAGITSREHRKLVVDKEKWLAIEKDIVSLQLVFNDHLFDSAASLMIMKWTAEKDPDAFRKYVENQWLLSLPFWYEGSANLSPSTNNGLESLNHKIKQMYTLRNKLSLSSFLQTAERAYQWLQKLDQTKVLHLGAASYVVPSSEQKMGTSLWVQYYHSMSWNSYDELIDWLNSARLVDFLV
ncbi:unnamed protein product [Didymodactylos carnosus]|uniref:MULE transposase domain-containing protein n=1 Tax=Didymodactylos carnosus TaxID=1234261 RepID=A0A814K519_9BILA|nr:unnamed protein product [Didymodactylos carnosus]CAF3817522.1 unnamed protein product [Didymodactylos carnosus]